MVRVMFDKLQLVVTVRQTKVYRTLKANVAHSETDQNLDNDTAAFL